MMAMVRKARERRVMPKRTVERHMPAMYARMKRKVATSQGRINQRDPRTDPYMSIRLGDGMIIKYYIST